MSVLKSIVALIALLIILSIGYLIFDALTSQNEIMTFDECVLAGHLVTDGPTKTCQTPDGEIFTEVLADEQITDFATCAAAGYPVMESFPPQCRTASGQTFTQDIGNEFESGDLIRITQPRPNTEATTPLQVHGEARGNWFFEATFPVVLVDDNGKELARTYAEATSDWMTENFVPFTATVPFSNPTSATGRLILEKSNPSGLPEQADSLIVPISFSDFIPNSNQTRTLDGCVITGCSAQVCADQEVATTCEYRDSYACYETTICGRNPDGQCVWQETPALTQCLENLTS